MDYDNWKLSSPYDECTEEYVKVDVEVEIFDLGQNVIDEFKNETSKINFHGDYSSLTTTIRVDAVLTCDDFEKECYVEENAIEDAVYEFLGKGCEYKILNWKRV